MGKLAGMSTGAVVAQTLKTLQAGPRKGVPPPTEQEVRAASKADRDGYINAVKALLRRMADKQLKSPNINVAQQYAEFSHPWVSGMRDGVSRFYAGYLDSYLAAIDAGLLDLEWQNPAQAEQLVKGVQPKVPDAASDEGLGWMIVLGQLQSLYSRDEAAGTFRTVREHRLAKLVAAFYRDMGVFTYYSKNHIRTHRRDMPSLSAMTTYSNGQQQSDHAIVISVDESYFRTFAPMILFNAQQVPAVDYVLLLCTDTETSSQVAVDAQRYVDALAGLNRQSVPSNIRFHVTPKPGWVRNPKTFYASARFLALPELVEQYKTVYSMDADLFTSQNPHQYLRGPWSTAMSAAMNPGLVSVVPWRRYMGGNVVATQAAGSSSALRQLIDYFSVGLAEPRSWMLDQNALSYVADLSSEGEFGPLERGRLGSVAQFMSTWKQNYKRTLGS